MVLGIDARYAFRTHRRGIGEYVAALLRHLPEMSAPEDRFILYIDEDADSTALTLADDRFRWQRLPVRNPLLWEEWALPRAAAKDRLDLLHLTSNYGPSHPPCPTVYTIHDLIEFIRPQFGRHRLPFRHAAGRAIRIRTLPRQARRARRVITISQASCKDLIDILALDAERVRVIPQGVPEDLSPNIDTQALRSRLRARGYPIPDQYVLAMGALDPRKNGPFLMRSFEAVHAAFPGVHLWIVGVERPAEYTLPFDERPSWLTVTGFLDRDVLLDILRGATAFVYPSLYEGFGLPVLEAMACGTPVLSSNRSSLPEVVGDGGLLFDPHSEHDLADALTTVLGDPVLRGALITAGTAQAARFSWNVVARGTYDVYREAIADA